MSGSDSTSRAAYVERQMKLNAELSKDDVFLTIKAKVSKKDIRKTVIDLVVQLDKMDLRPNSDDRIEQTKKNLNDLFDEEKWNMSYKGDTSFFVHSGKGRIREGRAYWFLWETLEGKECYQFQLKANKCPANEHFITSDFETAKEIILGYFKENKIKARKI